MESTMDHVLRVMIGEEVDPADGSGYLPWLAVAGAWLAFGSFAVPMKWQSVVESQVEPLVYQCYKTAWTFATSHLVLFFMPYEFTWWGILSGLSWVPAGVCAVIAVQNVGIAYGQAVWQVTIIMTSCVWGFAILQDEQVKNWWGTAIALACLIIGVVGMTISFNMYKAGDEDDLSVTILSHAGVTQSHASGIPDVIPEGGEATPSTTTAAAAAEVAAALIAEAKEKGDISQRRHTTGDVEEGKDKMPLSGGGFTPTERGRSATSGGASAGGMRHSASNRSLTRHMSSFRSELSAHSSVSGISGPRRQTRSTMSDVRYAADDVIRYETAPDGTQVPTTSVALGLSAALFNGVWGGSNLVPSKYAPLHGIKFVISFATGALIINVAMMLLYCSYIKIRGHRELPKPHFRTMALPGFLSGTMWSAGNFFSLYVVNAIGQGIGNSLVQSSVICSGLWGILLYKEMKGYTLIYWSFFCTICLVGVVVLALERKE